MADPASLFDRRRFIGALPAAALTVAAARPAARSAEARPAARRLEAVGLQLYTLRSLLATRLEATLAEVARIGYREVELAGLYGRTAADMRRALDAAGLRAIASHHSLREVRDNGARVFDDANTLGQQYVIVASLDRADRTLDAYRRVAEDFNRAGEAARAAGLRFGYHNHDYGFRPIDGVVPYDLLLERCDPSLVVMEMDLYWVVSGGGDPLAYLRAHPGRFRLFHVKDRTADGRMVNVGEGDIDFAAIFAQAGAALEHAFVEHDEPTAPLADIAVSYAAVRRLAGL